MIPPPSTTPLVKNMIKEPNFPKRFPASSQMMLKFDLPPVKMELTLQPAACLDFASYGGGGLIGPDPENKVWLTD